KDGTLNSNESRNQSSKIDYKTPPPTVTVSVDNPNVTEGTDTYAVFKVSLSAASLTNTSFSLALADISAQGGGVDYGAVGLSNIQVSTNNGGTWTSSTN